MTARHVLPRGFAAAVLLATAWPAHAQAPPAATAAPFAKPPVIDGRIDPGEWEGATRVTGLQSISDHLMDPRMATAYCGFTQETLYVAMVSEIAPTGPFISAKNRDADLIADDGIEIWLDPNRDTRASGAGDLAFYQFIGNPAGTIQDVKFDAGRGAPDKGWNGHWRFANTVDRKAGVWTAEVSIPFTDLGWKPGTAVGRSIGVLIARNYKAPWNQVTWFPHTGAFEKWSEYPRLQLAANAPSLQIESLGENVFASELQLRARLCNPGPARQVAAKLLITSSDMPELKDERLLDMPAQSSAAYAFDVPKGRLHEAARHSLSLVVENAQSHEQYFNWGLGWTNVRDAMKRLGSGKKWEVRTGPNPDAAVQVAYYPSYRFVRVKVDTDELGPRGETIGRAGVTVTTPSRKAVVAGAMRLEKGGAVKDFPLPDLPDGEYAVTVALAGWAQPFVRTFTRKHFPWEGNTLGVTTRVYPPFEPIRVKGRDIHVALRRYRSDGLGLWSSVASEGRELLAAPMALRADGKALVGSGRFSAKGSHRVVYEGAAATASAMVRTRCTTEYDGCMRVELTLAPGKSRRKLNSLVLEIPLVDREAPLWHCCTTGLRVNPAGAAPPGEGDVWDSRKFPDGEWYGNFKPYLWLGGEERGLCWFADNDRGWVLDVKRNTQAPCLVLHRKKSTLTLRVNLVQKPFVITQPRRIVFGLMATPAKPMPKDWRAITFAPSRKGLPAIYWMGSQYWGADTDFSAKYPRNRDLTVLDAIRDARLGKPVDVEAVIAGFGERNFKPAMPLGAKSKDEILYLLKVAMNIALEALPGNYLCAYWEEFHSTNPLHEEVATFKNEWSGTFDFGGTGALVPSYRDFACWYAAEFVKRGIGLYLDNAFPKRAYDPVTSSAYVLPNGAIQPSAGMWAHREYLKRIWVIHQELGPRDIMPLMMIHMTNTHIIPYMVWNEANLDLEWFYGPEPAQSKYAADLLRAESLGRQSGNIPLALARTEGASGDRTRFGALMVHEIKPEPYGRGPAGSALLGKLYDFGYGRDDCEVFNYWKEDCPVAVGDERVKWLLLRRGAELMLLLCTWNPKPQTTSLSFDGESLRIAPRQARDEETGEALAFDSQGKLVVPMERYGVRLIRLK
jgi:hypothetical protein